MQNPTSLKPRRRLQDLYVRGQMFSVDDGSDPENPVEVWVQKITPLEQKNAIDKAHSARARIRASKNTEDGVELRTRLQAEAQIAGFFVTRENMIDFVEAEELRRKQMSHEAEIAGSERWSENDYLNGLRTAWEDGLMERYLLDSNDPEASGVYEKLKDFFDEVDEKMQAERRAMIFQYESTSDNELKEKIVDMMVDGEADEAWLTEFRKWQVFFAIRDPKDHNQRYFESRDDVDTIDQKILRDLFTVFDELMVDITEGKE